MATTRLVGTLALAGVLIENLTFGANRVGVGTFALACVIVKVLVLGACWPVRA